MQFNDSDLHSRIADIARFLENNVPGKYSFMDGGTTLEIESDALMQCQWNNRWAYLTERYEQVGCYWYEAERRVA